MKQFLIITALFCCTFITCAQTAIQHDSPAWLVNRFFSASSFLDKSDYFIDEMIKQVNYPTIGEELHGEAAVKINEIEKTTFDAVFSVSISNLSDQKDFYCYLKNQNGWKISAIRTFIIPLYYHLLADSIMNDAELPDSTKIIAKSIRLLTGTDEKLKEYFKLHYNEFRNLLDKFRNDQSNEIKPLLQQLYLSSIYKPEQFKECFFFSVLEINYLESGYVYCADKSLLPKISPNDFIIIEEIVKDWYFYRRN